MGSPPRSITKSSFPVKLKASWGECVCTACMPYSQREAAWLSSVPYRRSLRPNLALSAGRGAGTDSLSDVRQASEVEPNEVECVGSTVSPPCPSGMGTCKGPGQPFSCHPFSESGTPPGVRAKPDAHYGGQEFMIPSTKPSFLIGHPSLGACYQI